MCWSTWFLIGVGCAIVLVAVVLAVVSAPDIRRYIRIRQM
jgi:hypothetical protein